MSGNVRPVSEETGSRIIIRKLKKTSDKIREYLRSHKVLRLFVLFFICGMLAILAVLLGVSGYMRSVDHLFEDSCYQKISQRDGRIVVIGITERDFEGISQEDLPEIVTECLEILNGNPETAPAVIGVDLPVLYKETEKRLAGFSSAVQKNNVVVGSELKIQPYTVVLDDGLLSEEIHAGIPLTHAGIPQSPNQESHTNLWYDKDGIIRHYRWEPLIAQDGGSHPSFAARCCEIYLQKNGKESGCRVPVSQDGMTMIRFSQPGDGFVDYSVSDILNGAYPEEAFANRIVLIGFTDDYQEREYGTALNRSDPQSNVEIQANMISCALNQRSIIEVPLRIQLLVLWVVTTVFLMIMFSFALKVSLIVYAAVMLSNLGISGLLWQNAGYAMHPLYYYVSVSICIFVGIFMDYQRRETRRTDEQQLLSRYMDVNVRRELLSGGTKGNSISGKRRVAILFADIRNFTALSEAFDTEDIVTVLNTYLSIAEETIHKYGGTVDKFIGDCVMAFWEDQNNDGSAVFDACRAAIEIRDKTADIDDYVNDKYGRQIIFGMGINYGEAIVGDIGSKTRRDYTVIGATVNFASRLEARAPSGAIYLSRTVHDILGENAEYTIIPRPMRFKGISTPEQVYILEQMKENADSAAVNPESFISRQDDASGYRIYILGSRGSYATAGKVYTEYGGQTSCYILKHGQHAVILDCGTGLYNARRILKDCTTIDVLLSHVHYDHCLGLLDWSVFPEGVLPTFYGKFGSWLGENTIHELFREPFWPVDNSAYHMVDISYEKEYVLEDDIRTTFFPSPHPNEASLTYLVAGGRRVCVMVDCERSDGMPEELVRNCDILIYDGMYDDNDRTDHSGWGHSTWQEGVRLAQREKVGHLIITHHNTNKTDSQLNMREKEARNEFPDTIFARAGDIVRL